MWPFCQMIIVPDDHCARQNRQLANCHLAKFTWQNCYLVTLSHCIVSTGEVLLGNFITWQSCLMSKSRLASWYMAILYWELDAGKGSHIQLLEISTIHESSLNSHVYWDTLYDIQKTSESTHQLNFKVGYSYIIFFLQIFFLIHVKALFCKLDLYFFWLCKYKYCLLKDIQYNRENPKLPISD